MPVSGGCRCGAVRYRIEVESMPGTYACHCTICQRATGSSFSHQMLVREDALAVTGEVVEVAIEAPSGGTSTQRYCARCFARIDNTNTRWRGIALPADVPAYADAAPPEAYRVLVE